MIYPVSKVLLPDKRQLLEPYRWFYGIIPAGYAWDGASIPRFLWSIFGGPFWPQFIVASLVHDWMLEKAILDKLEADLLFRDNLKAAGVGKLKRNLMYRAVRMFGRGSY